MALPSSIPSILNWWDASDDSTITNGDSENVETIDDKIGSIDLTQNNDVRRPVLTKMGKNSLQAIDYSGNAAMNLALTVAQAQPFEIWMSIKFTDISFGTGYVWDGLVIDCAARSNNILRIGGATKDDTDIAVLTNVNEVMVLRFLIDGTNSQVWKNNVAMITNSVDIGSDAIQEFNLGNRVEESNGLPGIIGECFINNGTLSATEVTDMWKYMERWLNTQSITRGPRVNLRQDIQHSTREHA